MMVDHGAESTSFLKRSWRSSMVLVEAALAATIGDRPRRRLEWWNWTGHLLCALTFESLTAPVWWSVTTLRSAGWWRSSVVKTGSGVGSLLSPADPGEASHVNMFPDSAVERLDGLSGDLLPRSSPTTPSTNSLTRRAATDKGEVGRTARGRWGPPTLGR